MATEKTELSPIPAAKEFCLTVPIYERFSFDNAANNPFRALEQFKGTLDFHCPECGQHSVFAVNEKSFSLKSGYSNYVFSLEFHCSRNIQHRASFVFRAHRGVLQKIGQFPSLADLALPDLRKYRSVLGDERYREFTRAIGLATHGVGVGAFVYLRRVFESLVEQAHATATAKPGWDDEAFVRCRMEEKIGMLKEALPDFLVQNRGLYSVLSVGVHTLSEEQCLAAFPAVRLAIELILDDLLKERERQAKLKSAAESLATLRANGGVA